MKYVIAMPHRYFPVLTIHWNKLQMNSVIVMLQTLVVHLNAGVVVAQVVGAKIHTYNVIYHDYLFR